MFSLFRQAASRSAGRGFRDARSEYQAVRCEDSGLIGKGILRQAQGARQELSALIRKYGNVFQE